MSLLAGDISQAQEMALLTLEKCAQENPVAIQDKYWLAATEAEAALIIEDLGRASKALHRAEKYHEDNWDAVATTTKQLRLISKIKGYDLSILEPLHCPTVIFYSGHMISPPGCSGRFMADHEDMVAANIDAAMETHAVKFGYGSLASGSDILFAEALIRCGAELHVVFPFEIEEFKTTSVNSAKGNWTSRFENCLEKARSITFATEDSYMGDNELFGFAGRIAMGLAKNKAQNLATTPKMFAVWDGLPPSGPAGTGADVINWRRQKFTEEIFSCGPPLKNVSAKQPEETSNKVLTRTILPVMFADVKGFSLMKEEMLPSFYEILMGNLGKALDSFGDKILFRNTWGDAVHAVFKDIETAVQCALMMRRIMQETNFEEHGLPKEVGLRIALHTGPVFDGYDYVTKQASFFGSSLTRAARIEPKTPVGEIYVTENFAAISEFECEGLAKFEYVGRIPLAKDYGEFRMYHLQPKN